MRNPRTEISGVRVLSAPDIGLWDSALSFSGKTQ